MFYGPEQLKCFPMPTMRFQHWVFHEFVAFIYTIVITLYCFVFINLNIYGSDVYVVHFIIIRCPQLKSIYCGMEHGFFGVFQLPE